MRNEKRQLDAACCNACFFGRQCYTRLFELYCKEMVLQRHSSNKLMRIIWMPIWVMSKPFAGGKALLSKVEDTSEVRCEYYQVVGKSYYRETLVIQRRILIIIGKNTSDERNKSE